MSLRRWTRRGYGWPLRRPAIDLWLGGPNADGRGLDTINGGYAPAPGLTITSPSASTPASTARFLIRDSTGASRDKAAGVLAGIGGRVWTGSGWTYAGATDVTALGPLPALSVPGVTDTVRRYSATTGLTVSDGTGGTIQPYSQRADIATGESGGGWPVNPPETWSSVGENDFIYTHTIAEYPTGHQWSPYIGLYNGSFVQGQTTFYVDTLAVTSVMTGGAAGIRSLGTGPNGGRLVEYWTGTLVQAAQTTLSALAYLLRAIDTSTPRTCWIHNHFAVRIPYLYGRLYGFPSCILVGAGAAPSLAVETLRVTLPTALPVTAAVRTGPTDPADTGYYDALVANSVYTYVRLYRFLGQYAWYLPQIVFGTTTYTSPRTLAFRIDAINNVTGALDGVMSSTGGVNTAPLASQWYIGGHAEDRSVAPLRRVQLWSRHLSAAEIAAAHAAIVAAEA